MNRTVNILVLLLLAWGPMVYRVQAGLTVSVHVQEEEWRPSHYENFADTDHNPAITVSASGYYLNGASVPNISVYGVPTTGVNWPTFYSYVPGERLIAWAQWDGHAGGAMAIYGQYGAAYAYYRSSTFVFESYTWIQITLTREFVSGSWSYDPRIAGADPQHVAEYDVIDAAFSGKPSFGPGFNVGDSTRVDAQTVDVQVPVGNFDVSTIGTSNFLLRDNTGRTVAAQQVYKAFKGFGPVATYRFVSDQFRDGELYALVAQPEELLSAVHGTPPQFWEYVQDTGCSFMLPSLPTSTVKGRVVTAVNREAVAGAVVSLAGRNATTAADGTFTLEDVSLASVSVLTVTKTDFSPYTEPRPPEPGPKSLILPDILLQPPGFRVTAIKSKYDGLFIAGVSVANEYTALINWDGHSPGAVEFRVNGAYRDRVAADATRAVINIDMGTGFYGAFRPDANKVEAVAIDAQGNCSEPFAINVGVVQIPYILVLPVLPFEFIPGNDPGYHFTVQIPATHFETTVGIPRLDSIKLDAAVTGELDYRLLTGKWELSAGVKAEKPKFSWGKQQSGMEFSVRGSGLASQTSGFVVDEVGYKLLLEKTYTLDPLLSDLAPAGKLVRVFNLLSRVGFDVNSLQRVNVEGRFEVAADLVWEYESLSFKNGMITPGGKLKAIYHPKVLGGNVEVALDGSVTFPIKLPGGGSVKGEVTLGIKMDVWLLKNGEWHWVLLSGEYPPPVQGAQVSLPVCDAEGKVVWIDGLMVGGGSDTVRPIDRPYLLAGPERFVGAGLVPLVKTAGNSLAPVPLDAFRKIGVAPVKGAVGWVKTETELTPSVRTAAIANGVSTAESAQVDLPLVVNAFPSSQPTLAGRGPELMLLYVSDNGSSNALQYTDIRWTHWDGTNWSVPQAIQTNTQAEFAPQVAYDGNGDAIAVWERVADPNFTNADLTAMAAQMEIAWSRWDRASGVWTVPQALTANNILDHAPLLCGPLADGSVMAVWTRNDSNLLVGTNGAGSQVFWTQWNPVGQAWSMPQTLVEDLPYRLSQSLAGASSRAVYAWTRDLDGVLTNAADQQVFSCEWDGTAWGEVVQFTTNSFGNRNVRVSVGPTGEVFAVWQQGPDLVMCRDFATNVTTVRADSQTAGFADYAMTFGPAGNLVLLWQEMSEDGSDAHYMVYDPVSDTWGQDARLCSDAPLERSFAPVWDDQGNLAVAYEKVTFTNVDQTVELDGGGTITVTNVPQPGRVDLYVTKHALIRDLSLLPGDFTVDGANFLPGAAVTLSATVRNVGDVAMTNVSVEFFDGDPLTGGTSITNITSAGWFEGAATNAVTTSWIVPEPATDHTLFAVVNRGGAAAEFDPTNNSQSLHVGGTDLSVSLVRYAVETNGALHVVGQVYNAGAPSAPSSVLAIRRTDATGTNISGAILATAAVPDLPPGRLAQVALELPAGTQPDGEAFYRLTVDDDHVTGDVEPANNATSFAVNLWIDSDGDGIPNWWMMSHFGHPTGLAGDKSRAEDDADGDGISNYAEWCAGTDPQDTKSFLNVQGIASLGTNDQAGGFLLTWGSTSNKFYTIERTSNLVNGVGFTPIQEHILATPPINIYQDTSVGTNSGPFFYRIGVENGAEFSLVPSSGISGTVTGPDNITPLAGIQASAYRWAGVSWALVVSGATDTNGNYTFTNLVPGIYRVAFSASQNGTYLPQVYSNVVDLASGTDIVLSEATTVTGIDASLVLPPPSKISGTITGPDTITPLAGILAEAYWWNGSWWSWIASTNTDTHGKYAFANLVAGTYRVEFSDWENGNHAPEAYNDAVDLDSATDIVVPGATTVTSIDASLAVASRISGTVTGPDTITPLVGIQASAYRWTGAWWNWINSGATDTNGTFTIGSLAAGTYRVEFSDGRSGNYITEVYDNAGGLDSGKDIAVAAAATVTRIDASLAAASRITGTVTGSDSVTPLAGIQAIAFCWKNSAWNWVATGFTDTSGNFIIGGMTAGTYRVAFSDGWPPKYVGEVYDNVPNLDAGTDVVLAAATTVTGINASLQAVGQP